MAKISNHVEEYIGRYVVIASVVLVPLAGALGAAAANLGGADTTLGRALLAAASAVGAAAAIGVWLKNLGLWQVATQPTVLAVETPLTAAHPAPPEVKA